jgi:DNA (cytosine-5)-methyltransferase 1
MLTSLELCSGGGGQALGIEQAGFTHVGVVDNDASACATLRLNRPGWTVYQSELQSFDGRPFKGIDLLAGGLPCPPFSVAGKQLGAADDRNLFPAALRLVDEIRPGAILIENVRGILDPRFDEYRIIIIKTLRKLGYALEWRIVNASDFGIPQLRPRAVLVALRTEISGAFSWPDTRRHPLPPTVGETLFDLMGARGWALVEDWKSHANGIAPTIVGGSKKHGGPDLGPTRARSAWAALGVDGLGIADGAPARDFVGMPRLTSRMVARLQGFQDTWTFAGNKTSAYRQIGNAFPPPVATAIAERISIALRSSRPAYLTLSDVRNIDAVLFRAPKLSKRNRLLGEDFGRQGQLWNEDIT